MRDICVDIAMIANSFLVPRGNRDGKDGSVIPRRNHKPYFSSEAILLYCNHNCMRRD